MNTPPCGAPHHLYPDTLCTEPAGHYRRDRDPHAGPLIVGGRERGGAAWDEPKERRMSDRHTADTITDDALDQLYAQLDELHQEIAAAGTALADMARKRNEQMDRADRAEADRKTLGQTALGYQQRAWDAEAELKQAQAALDRVRALHPQEGDYCAACTTDFGRLSAPWPCPTIRAIGEEPAPAPAATQATDDEHLGGHPAQPGAPRCTATWQIPDTGQLARCWRPADHNTSPGYQTHMGETEQGSRHQWIGTEPGAVPHRDAIDQPKEQ